MPFLIETIMLSYFFFFQAEDGIRDWSVTGVQTCALPISLHLPHDALSQTPQSHHAAAFRRAQRRVNGAQQRRADDAGALERLADDARRQRSEERRVGKEGRSRWSPYH